MVEKFNETDLMKEIKSCTYEQDYETAVKLADKLELNKIRNVSSLCLLGEVFLHEGELDSAEKVLLKAYEKMPKGRRGLDLLTELYIEKESYSEAEYYYKEFISVASRDLHRYILRYRLDKGKGERVSVLIHTLEQLKDYEYIEEWAYELAKLYHEAGEDKKCVRECDEIALWFGHGEYVDLAMALKDEVTGKVHRPVSSVTDPSMQQTVGATYMFDSEGLLERSGLNVPLNVDEYMKEDDEYSDVYDLEEGGRTESLNTIGEISDAAEDVPEKTAAEPAGSTEKTVEEPIEEPVEAETSVDSGATTVLDTAVIAAKAAEILAKSRKDDGADTEEIGSEASAHEISGADFVARIQKNIENETGISSGTANKFFENRRRIVTPEALEEADDNEDVEVIDDKMNQTTYDLFFGGHPEAKTAEVSEETAAAPEAAGEPEKAETVRQEASETVSKPEYEDEIVNEDIPVPDTVLDIFATAVDIKDVKKQLAETFTKLESSLLDKEDILAPYDINFVVSGTDESMKSQISIGIAKALNTYGMCDKGKIVRADSGELNAMDFSPVFDKISGGCLIIGGAGMLSETSVKIISDYVNRDEQKVAIVMEDSETDLNRLWKKYPKLRSKFLNVINISKYDESELVKLAESYAKRRGYEISEEVRMVTLREIFEKRMASGEDVNYEDVMAVIDEAVVNLEKRNMKNLFMTVLDNAYKEASMFTLLPEDFD